MKFSLTVSQKTISEEGEFIIERKSTIETATVYNVPEILRTIEQAINNATSADGQIDHVFLFVH